MTSLFDTQVANRRKQTQWARINLLAFMREMAYNAPFEANIWEHEVVLKVHKRHDVSSRMWWTLEWTGADEQRHSVDSQDFDLLLWRAAEMESQIQERVDQERRSLKEVQAPKVVSIANGDEK